MSMPVLTSVINRLGVLPCGHNEVDFMDLSTFPYLQGNYAPVSEERDLGMGELRVEGEIPPGLTGAFMRDGANVAFQPNHYVYPADGDGMVHAEYIRDGGVQYRNRWVREQPIGHRIRWGQAQRYGHPVCAGLRC